MGLNHRSKPNKYSDEFLVELYHKYGTYEEAAKHIDVSRETIARAVRRSMTPIIMIRYCNTKNSQINVCAVCGEKFEAKRKSGKYCSNKCRNRAQTTGVAKQRKKQQKITDAQILDGIARGFSRKEIAYKYHVHPENLSRRMSRLGVHAEGYENNWKKGLSAAQEAHRCIFSDTWHYVDSHDKKIQDKHCDFIYLESRNLSKKTKRIRLKCKKCGSVIERALSSINGNKIRCDFCNEREKEERDVHDKRVELTRFFIALKEYKTPKVCKGCGEIFYSEITNKEYCSDHCRKKSNAKRKGKGNWKKRCKKYGALYDRTITAAKVFERDGYICKICGLPCDPNDNTWGLRFGPNAPTIDHIVALANGGSHTWDNVQCAHAMCNSVKRDLIAI